MRTLSSENYRFLVFLCAILLVLTVERVLVFLEAFALGIGWRWQFPESYRFLGVVLLILTTLSVATRTGWLRQLCRVSGGYDECLWYIGSWCWAMLAGLIVDRLLIRSVELRLETIIVVFAGSLLYTYLLFRVALLLSLRYRVWKRKVLGDDWETEECRREESL